MLPTRRRCARLAIAAALAFLVGSGGEALASSAAGPQDVASAQFARIPPRDVDAPSGSDLVARISGLSREERGAALVEQILRGNVPSFLRRLRPVAVSLPDAGGSPVRLVFWAMPDYLAVGSDEDFVRVPLGLAEALAVARELDCTLPTARMVDSIYRQAERKLAPQPMPAGPEMTSVTYFWQHNQTIARQLEGLPSGALVAGDKKDLVLTRRLAARPGRVAIYGWHRGDGDPIQPLSTVHGAGYADYSHGVRLVSSTVFVDGEPRSVFDLLEDPALVELLSDEGVDGNARRVLGGRETPAYERAALAR
jgi:hypothetical protein